MQNYYQFLIPRLNGPEIGKDFKKHLSLVKKGIAGFIIFGGRLEEIRRYIKKLQEESEHPLIISSDLEQGLGQQIKGGTLFPPAMAIGSVYISQKSKIKSQKLRTIKEVFKAMADEAKYAGINTIFAPVLDINTNPKNPIICVRAFGEDTDTVSLIGCLMIRTLQQAGIITCGKHFPGHGDTEVDSHIKLPSIDRSLRSLSKKELKPFRDAIKAGVKMIMLGHLSVPAIDPSGIPASISRKTVRFIRNKMNYDGILITDAMNMGSIGKFSEEVAAFMALNAGVDIVLHPSNPEKVVSYLEKKKCIFNIKKLERFRRKITWIPSARIPDLSGNQKLSSELAEKAIRISGKIRMTDKPILIILNDEEKEKGQEFSKELKKVFPDLKTQVISINSEIQEIRVSDNDFLVVALFSETKAWKGGASKWLFKRISSLKNRADLFISFGSPYLLDNIKGAAKISTFWDSGSAQKAVAKIIAASK
jgi:beta-N-acetylhexosaminidase